MPGMLIPDDIERMATACGSSNPLEWAKENLAASPGATVIIQGDSEPTQIPTLVPRRKEDGSCSFLTEDGKCQVHGQAPYGCAFFDSHMEGEPANGRSAPAIFQILMDWRAGDYYSNIWQILAAAGHTARGPQDSRREMSEQYKDTTWAKEAP